MTIQHLLPFEASQIPDDPYMFMCSVSLYLWGRQSRQ
jgi:hypothetical protein